MRPDTLLLPLAKRYIAGASKEDAVEAAQRLNSLSIAATIDNLGENVSSVKEAEDAVSEYISLLSLIKQSRVNSAVSLKLTHLGLDLSEDIALKNAEVIIKKAALLNNFVRFDMEGSKYTQKTLDIFLKLCSRYPNMGIAIQSYLLRSKDDIKLLNENNASVRLVKGAYKEPPDIAFEKKKDVDKNYGYLMKELLLKGNMPAIATHDARLINEAISFAAENRIGKNRFEFEMLLGIKRTLQKRLAGEGFRVRVYVPYGKNWLAYTLRRFRERKENIFFVLKNLID